MFSRFAAIIGMTLMVAMVGQSRAGIISYQGNLLFPDQIFTLDLTLSAPSKVSIQGYGYGGGSNGSGELILAGGFDTVISLFSGSGISATLIEFNDDGICPPGSFDPVTGGCLDSTLIRDLLSPGTYMIALSASFNMPIGPTLGAGFSGEGSFLDVFGDSRTSSYAFDVTVGSLQVISEPSTLVLLFGPLLLAIFPRIRLRARR